MSSSQIGHKRTNTDTHKHKQRSKNRNTQNEITLKPLYHLSTYHDNFKGNSENINSIPEKDYDNSNLSEIIHFNGFENYENNELNVGVDGSGEMGEEGVLYGGVVERVCCEGGCCGAGMQCQSAYRFGD